MGVEPEPSEQYILRRPFISEVGGERYADPAEPVDFFNPTDTKYRKLLADLSERFGLSTPATSGQDFLDKLDEQFPTTPDERKEWELNTEDEDIEEIIESMRRDEIERSN